MRQKKVVLLNVNHQSTRFFAFRYFNLSKTCYETTVKPGRIDIKKERSLYSGSVIITDHKKLPSVIIKRANRAIRLVVPVEDNKLKFAKVSDISLALHNAYFEDMTTGERVQPESVLFLDSQHSLSESKPYANH